MISTRLARALMAVGAAAVLAVAGTTPAQAQAQPTLGVFFDDLTIALSAPGLETSAILFASEPVTLTNIVLTFDFSDIASFATVVKGSQGFPSTCTLTAPTVLACLSSLPLHVNTAIGVSSGVVIAAAPSAALGNEGTLHVTLQADGVAPISHDSRVRTGTPANLDAGPLTTASVPFGQPFTDTQQVTNVGADPVHGVGLFLFGDPGIRAATKYSNCTYVGDHPFTCRFDQVLNPGVTYEITVPYVISADTFAPSHEAAEYGWQTVADFEDDLNRLAQFNVDLGQPGSGGTLELTEVNTFAALSVETDVEPNNNFTLVDVTVTGDNRTDLAAIGSTVTGAVGDQVVATVGEKNNGPASIDRGRVGDPVSRVHVVIPPGTTAVNVPTLCLPELANGQGDFQHPGQPGQAKYICSGASFFLGAGKSDTFAITLRIDQVIPDATGTASILVPCRCSAVPLEVDTDHSNNVAKILVNPTVPANGLAATGNRVGLIGALGGLFLLLGAATVVLARRRRLPFLH